MLKYWLIGTETPLNGAKTRGRDRKTASAQIKPAMLTISGDYILVWELKVDTYEFCYKIISSVLLIKPDFLYRETGDSWFISPDFI